MKFGGIYNEREGGGNIGILPAERKDEHGRVVETYSNYAKKFK